MTADERDKRERAALTALIRWMDAFASCGTSQFAPRPATAVWKDYAPTEQAVARLAARDFMAAMRGERP